MSFQIYISQHNSDRTKVSVADSEEDFNNTTVKELKRLIPFRYIISKLLYKDVELEDDHTLGFYGIKHEDEIIAEYYEFFDVQLCSCSEWGSLPCRRRPLPSVEQSAGEYEEFESGQTPPLPSPEDIIIPRSRSMETLLFDMHQPQLESSEQCCLL